ncbi:hypothetical protein RMR16_025055 (plasmid) [Agrobacterium sp. rho-13.3]|uniref:hypothetical protein n=1 Tax=Agrobacterium sp. rho-13.3 TaxID=3072980 RepID=UPI002A13E3F2|nr:hypothetical protein [Agrobacterium sp. rho-13.3]MDX8310221.1 hypothetical protein [Agrobacterium sp. rho-13.3]
MGQALSRIEVLVSDLPAAISIMQGKFAFLASAVDVTKQDGFHVEFVTVSKGSDRLTLVRPIAGILKRLLDEKGEGTTYKLTYETTGPESVDVEVLNVGAWSYDMRHDLSVVSESLRDVITKFSSDLTNRNRALSNS